MRSLSGIERAIDGISNKTAVLSLGRDIISLRKENQDLKHQVAVLKEMLAGVYETGAEVTFPVEWGLMKSEQKVLRALLLARGNVVPVAEIMGREDGNNDAWNRIKGLRKKVPSWCEIKNVYGLGYSIPLEMRKRLARECCAMIDKG
ncbi:MAG: hypothetical protein JWL86_5426 [Rhizobium sp.]|nr:hypothetical protein [Rhizobium sp.]